MIETLENQIRQANSDCLSAAELAAQIEEANAAAAAAAAEHETLMAEALDPAQPQEVALIKREAALAKGFLRDRLFNAAVVLGRKHRAALDNEAAGELTLPPFDGAKS